MLTSKQVVEKIKKAHNVAIFAHKNPDPDAYGSMFAIRDLCKGLKVNADAFAIKNPKGYLDEIFPLEELKTDFVAKNFDLIIFVDQHLINRVDAVFHEELQKANNILIVDHHEVLENDDVPTTEILIQPEKSATAEIISDIIRENKLKVDQTIATYLWAGLIGDTARFLHNNLSANVLENAKFLFEQGADSQFVYDNMYRKNSYKQLKLHAQYIKKIKLICGGMGGYVIFRSRDFKRFKAEKEDVKKYTNEIVSIDGVKISILVIQYGKNDFKFSIRSRGVDALSVVIKYGGGGHENACGLDANISAFRVKRFTENLIKEILNVG
ncbi:MAG: bifunctional oligoribonuclease/PAP phosphatase NrnA [Candidatus Caccovivens sp.]